MKKDRFVAFFDAVMAIIMTIVVLEFAQPSGPHWSDLRGTWFQVLVYALSFFWLGMMWININTIWARVEIINRKIMWVNMFMLFFSSMIPFLVVYVGQNIMFRIPQLLYGIDVICITLCNQISAELLKIENPLLDLEVKGLRRGIAIDLGIKVVGIIIGMTVFPPAVIIAVFIAMLSLVVQFSLMNKRRTQAAKAEEEDGESAEESTDALT